MNSTLTSDRRWSLIGTFVFHGTMVLLLIVLMRNCSTGGGGGNGGLGYTGLMSMDVAGIGNEVDGWGDIPEEEAPVQNTITETSSDDANAITEESPVNDAPTVSNKPNTSASNKPYEKPKPAEKPKEQQVSGNLNNAFGTLSKGGQGNTSGSGKQGTSDGSIDGKGVMNGGGSLGDGGGQGGGSGTGTGPGTGPGSGPGSGGGFKDFELKGRQMRTAPSLSEIAPDEGVVVVNIWVDKNGNVTKAIANPAKSTTSNGQLYALAEKAAKKAKFSASTQNEQTGTIKITFKLH